MIVWDWCLFEKHIRNILHTFVILNKHGGRWSCAKPRLELYRIACHTTRHQISHDLGLRKICGQIPLFCNFEAEFALFHSIMVIIIYSLVKMSKIWKYIEKTVILIWCLCNVMNTTVQCYEHNCAMLWTQPPHIWQLCS